MKKKTIVITGSEGKIGKVLKNHFYKNNYDVVGLDLKKGLRTYKCNIVKENDVKKIFKSKFQNKFPDILINSASVIPKIKKFRFTKYSLSDWKKTLDVDLVGSFNVTKECCKLFEKKNRGIIINISSIYGVVGPDQNLYGGKKKYLGYKALEYSVAKSGLIGFTKSLAAYYKDTNIRVVCLVLGGVNDKLHKRKFLRGYLSKSIANRMISSDEIIPYIEFIIKNPKFITGSCLNVDGGVTTMI